MNRMQDNKFFENVSKVQMPGTNVTNQICIHEEIKSKLYTAMTAAIRSRISCLQFVVLKYK